MIVLQVILSFTRWGIHTVAVGSNRIGAAEAGIKVRGNLMRNFMMCAMLAGLAGILENVRAITLNPDPSATSNYLFLSISAAVIGGTLLQRRFGDRDWCIHRRAVPRHPHRRTDADRHQRRPS